MTTRVKADERIRTLINNGAKTRHRSMFVIIGDKSVGQIMNLHRVLSDAKLKARPTILWCYKDKLDLSSNKRRRTKQVKKLLREGSLDPQRADAFSLFLETTGITYCMYKDSERILGNTFDMCILQDFGAMTPNLLARTIETVEGGGLIVLLLRSLASLTALYTMVMDVHGFRTESHVEATGRFNERFLLSIASCKACMVLDDEFNLLPISSHMKSIIPVSTSEDSEGLLEAEHDLKNLKEQLKDDFPVGPLIRRCCTLDQGRAVITFLDAILDKTLCSTVALLAARGRGKSAALGLAVTGAIAAGYSNIFVTAPTPENLKTLFEFVCKGFDSIQFKEHIDFDVVRSSNPEFKKAIVRINVNKYHRQTIQYIMPNEHEKLSQVELLVIDEAAAIPLPVVKSLLGPYLVFISSTVNGYEPSFSHTKNCFVVVLVDNYSVDSYEGTGRSLSLKLLQQLAEQSQTSTKNVESSLSGRFFKKIELTESIRYASGDPIESWLNELLCLDVANSIPNVSRWPPVSDCDLYYVNRDTLFSYHRSSELFLQRMMSLYVVSHYKNSPNDLQLMADAPAHHLFVLLGPVESTNVLPDILCVIQVALEGQISRKSAIRSLSNGHQPHGDQIPWKFSEQFRDTVFPSLSGARIVRIATHPLAMRNGYGSIAVELLSKYYYGEFLSFSEVDFEDTVDKPPVRLSEAAEKVSLLEESITPRKDLPPLLVSIRDRRPERLNYLGVSFGLTLDLFRFWRKLKFAPFYIGQIANAVTGEHTCMVIRPLNSDEISVDESDARGFFSPFYQDFQQRFRRLLPQNFRFMDYKLAMSILDPKINFADLESVPSNLDGIRKSIEEQLSAHDIKRIQAYTDSLADFHLILDLIPILVNLYFEGKLPVILSYAQASVLLCIGLQHQNFSYIEVVPLLCQAFHGYWGTLGCRIYPWISNQTQMKLERQQVMSLFMKALKKFHKFIDGLASKQIDSTLPRLKDKSTVWESALKPHRISLDEDLNDAAKKVKDNMKAKTEGLLIPERLQEYAIEGEEADFEKALPSGGKISSGGLISVKSNKMDMAESREQDDWQSDKKRSKDNNASRSSKKRRT
ncbi:RNA cytidine acetyltransferase 1-like protein [Drosera capensis]